MAPTATSKAQTSALLEQLAGKPAGGLSSAMVAEHYEKSVAAPAMRTFDRDIAPRIKEAFAGAGATFSSRRGQAVGEALQGLNTDIVAKGADYSYNAMALNAQLADAAKGRQLSAIGAASTTQGLGLQNAAIYAGLAGQYQEQLNRQNMAQYNEFLRTTPEASPWLTIAMNYLNGVPTITDTKNRGGNAASGAVSGAMSGAMIGTSGSPGWGTLIGAVAGGALGATGGYYA